VRLTVQGLWELATVWEGGQGLPVCPGSYLGNRLLMGPMLHWLLGWRGEGRGRESVQACLGPGRPQGSPNPVWAGAGANPAQGPMGLLQGVPCHQVQLAGVGKPQLNGPGLPAQLGLSGSVPRLLAHCVWANLLGCPGWEGLCP